jgi:carbon-monoxide dehydrogenase medium subunit
MSAALKPPPFEYRAPRSLDEALSLVAEHGEDAKVLAGGQSLVPLMSMRLAHPAVIVDVNGVGELASIDAHDSLLTTGAMVRERAAERSGLVRSRTPLLAVAIPLIGHPAIRSRGTIGGSIAHADPAGELPTVAVALDAEVVARSQERGERTIPAADFFLGFFTTALEADEILTRIRWPAAAPGTGAAFEEACRRHGDFAMVGAAASVRVGAGSIAEARIALLAVADTPVRAHGAEECLVGAAPGDEAFRAAAELASRDLAPPSDLHASSAYRKHVAGVLVRRALEKAMERSRESR